MEWQRLVNFPATILKTRPTPVCNLLCKLLHDGENFFLRTFALCLVVFHDREGWRCRPPSFSSQVEARNSNGENTPVGVACLLTERRRSQSVSIRAVDVDVDAVARVSGPGPLWNDRDSWGEKMRGRRRPPRWPSRPPVERRQSTRAPLRES